MAVERLVGQVKWFSNPRNFGFLTVRTPGEFYNMDVFVHQINIKADGYRTLRKGEYVEFTRAENDNADKRDKFPYQATHVTGVLGGPLMCDYDVQNDNTEAGNDNGEFQKVSRPRHPRNQNRRHPRNIPSEAETNL